MTDEPQIHEINGDSNAPATKGDIEDLARLVAKSQEYLATKDDLKQFATKDDLRAAEQRLTGIEQKLTGVEHELESLKSSQAAILEVVQSIDSQLKEHATHPDRIARLEGRVFR